MNNSSFLGLDRLLDCKYNRDTNNKDTNNQRQLKSFFKLNRKVFCTVVHIVQINFNRAFGTVRLFRGLAGTGLIIGSLSDYLTALWRARVDCIPQTISPKLIQSIPRNVSIAEACGTEGRFQSQESSNRIV